jgi:hypothetical protein
MAAKKAGRNGRATARKTVRRPVRSGPRAGAKGKAAPARAAQVSESSSTHGHAAATGLPQDLGPFAFAPTWTVTEAAAPAAALMSISPERVIELQQNYMQRLAGLWTDFFREPEKMAEPIKDSRFADPAWRKERSRVLCAGLPAEFQS